MRNGKNLPTVRTGKAPQRPRVQCSLCGYTNSGKEREKKKKKGGRAGVNCPPHAPRTLARREDRYGDWGGEVEKNSVSHAWRRT